MAINQRKNAVQEAIASAVSRQADKLLIDSNYQQALDAADLAEPPLILTGEYKSVQLSDEFFDMVENLIVTIGK